jgi:hypothetical protein
MWQKFALLFLCSLFVAACGPDPAASTPGTKSAASSSGSSRMHFEHHEFVLDLPSSWTQKPGADPEQFLFESKSLTSMLTISVMPAAIPRDKLQLTGEKVLEYRRQAEVTTDASLVVKFGDQWVTPKPGEDVVEIGYAGYDNHGRIFRFMGFVTTQKVLNFYCETISRDNEQSKRIFDEAFRGFKFYIP